MTEKVINEKLVNLQLNPRHISGVYLKDIDSECTICYNTMLEPVSLECSHIFCLFCLIHVDYCPLCRKLIANDEFKINHEIQSKIEQKVGIDEYEKLGQKLIEQEMMVGDADIEDLRNTLKIKREIDSAPEFDTDSDEEEENGIEVTDEDIDWKIENSPQLIDNYFLLQYFEEIPDTVYHDPTQYEIECFATKLGIDYEKYPNLVYLAEQSMTVKLDENWQIYQSQEGTEYFYNSETCSLTKAHPIITQNFKTYLKLVEEKEILKQLGDLIGHNHEENPELFFLIENAMSENLEDIAWQIKMDDEGEKSYYNSETSETLKENPIITKYKQIYQQLVQNKSIHNLELDDDSPSFQEIYNIAQRMGFDMDEDQEFLFIAQECLKASVPEPWEEFQCNHQIIYVNPFTDQKLIDHPQFEEYRGAYLTLKKSRDNQREKRQEWQRNGFMFQQQ